MGDMIDTAAMVPGRKLHTRTYDIESFVVDDEHFRLDGRVRDVKPDGLWGTDDHRPLTIHDMTLSMTVALHGLTVTDVSVEMHTHPQNECPFILPSYQQLVGLSIARGFTHKVREMFGGPRACTHIGALINAMAPVAMQTVWSFSHRAAPVEMDLTDPTQRAAYRRSNVERNRDTCHVWATEGPMFDRLDRGEIRTTPLWAQRRLAELGVPLEEWEAAAY